MVKECVCSGFPNTMSLLTVFQVSLTITSLNFELVSLIALGFLMTIPPVTISQLYDNHTTTFQSF